MSCMSDFDAESIEAFMRKSSVLMWATVSLREIHVLRMYDTVRLCHVQ